MWFFMYSCYMMSLITFIALVIGFFQSFLNFPIFQAHHVTFMILTSILYLFTETLVIFFFVGTGVSVRDFSKENNLDPQYHKRSIAIKRRVYPPLLLNIFIMIIVFILVGAVDTFRLPSWIYQSVFIFGIVHYIKAKVIQNYCFRDNTQIILEMSGISS